MLNKAVIDLNILKDNVKKIKKLSGKAKFNAVVKADAYGHGAEIVANALYRYVDSFSVAIVEEGVRLRNSGIDKDVLCFTPCCKTDVALAVRNHLSLTVCSAEQLKLINTESQRQGRKIKAHIKFNTGMNRQGVDSVKELKELLLLAKTFDNVIIDGVYSHFSAPNKKKSLKCALNKFLLANNLVKGYNNKATCHISASGGLIAGVTLDMVRVGILTYGYTPFETERIKVKPVMKVYAPVICRRTLDKGQTALYNDKVAKSKMDLSLVRYGYADGLFRRQISGQFNNRCMDATLMADRKVTKWGYPIMENAQDVAEKYGTISYEVLTKSALRAEKIYLR